MPLDALPQHWHADGALRRSAANCQKSLGLCGFVTHAMDGRYWIATVCTEFGADATHVRIERALGNVHVIVRAFDQLRAAEHDTWSLDQRGQERELGGGERNRVPCVARL